MNPKNRVDYRVNEGIAFVQLNRPDKHNALDMPMFYALKAVIKTISRDKNVRVVIVSGKGESFCSGLDVKSVMHNRLDALKLLWKWTPGQANLAQQVVVGWRRLKVPVIMQLHGKCWGGGMQLALGGDFRIADTKTSLAIMESRWGLIPDMGGTIALRELASIDIIKELAMTARIFKGNEAKQLGLVTHVYDDPMAEAIQFAEEIKKRSPDAIANTKLLFNKTWLSTIRQALNWETKLQKRLIGRYNQRAAISQGTAKKDQAKPFKQRA